jgi:chorismate mutase
MIDLRITKSSGWSFRGKNACSRSIFSQLERQLGLVIRNRMRTPNDLVTKWQVGFSITVICHRLFPANAVNADGQWHSQVSLLSVSEFSA